MTHHPEKALAEFIAKIGQAEEMIKAITEAIDNHLGVDPESVTWGNVADAGRLVADLRNIMEYVGEEN